MHEHTLGSFKVLNILCHMSTIHLELEKHSSPNSYIAYNTIQVHMVIQKYI